MRYAVSALVAALVVPVSFAHAVVAEPDIDELIASMTLEEKLGQLTLVPLGEPKHLPADEFDPLVESWLDEIRAGDFGAIYAAEGAAWVNRLQRVAVEEGPHGIPLIVGNDIIHGYRTIFPIPLASSCTWDPEFAASLERVAAIESRAAGTHWTFAPMVDISRDPRWGRVAEGAGEDPYLGAQIGAARVRGFQGEGIDRSDAVLATAKHFAAYGAAEGGRDYDTTDMSEQTLRTIYLPPFKAAVEAGVGTLMTSFNDISGVPATANDLLLQDILRGEWAFDGFITSDYTSINEMVAHGYARDLQHAAVMALGAGTDMDLSGRLYANELPDAIERGLISEATIDRSVRRVLEMKQRLGLFENPYGDLGREAEVTLSDEHRALAREAAARSVVLLKNEGDLLPLDATSGRIVVIGPLAEGKTDALGTWAGWGKADDAVELLTGLRDAVEQAAGSATIEYVRGCPLLDEDRSGFDAAVRAARNADVVILAVGEPQELSGEGHSRSDIGLPGVQQELVDAVIATGTPVVALVASGRPMAIPELAEGASALVATWHLGVEHGNGIADVVFGRMNPSGKLTMTWPRTEGQIPIYYARKSTGRPYRPDERYVNRYLDLGPEPLFAFGYGLSYTSFELSGLSLDRAETGPAGTVTASVTVTNTGERTGAEVVQLYIHDEVATLVRPVRELRGFERVELEPGESREVSFELGPNELGLWNRDMRFVVEPGWFTLYVSTSSAGGLETRFEVIER